LRPGLQPAEVAERHRAAGLDGQVAQAQVVVAEGGGVRQLASDRLAGQLEDAGVQLAHRADQPPHLVPCRQPARHRPPVRRLVDGRARRGEADRAGLDGGAQLPLHRAQVVLGGRLLEGALAHHVAAQRAVADVAGVVDPLGQGVDRVEELGKRRPRPADAGGHRGAGDVLGALQVAHDQGLVLLRARRQREAAVAHDDAGHAVPAGAGAEGIPEDLRVHVGVAVDEAGRHDHAVGVHDLAGALADAADRRDAAVLHGHVGAMARQAGAIDEHAVLDDEVVGHRCVLRACGMRASLLLS